MTVDGKDVDKDRVDGLNDLLHAVLDHAMKVPSKSPCKRETVEFVGKLFLVSFSPCLLYGNLTVLP